MRSCASNTRHRRRACRRNWVWHDRARHPFPFAAAKHGVKKDLHAETRRRGERPPDGIRAKRGIPLSVQTAESHAKTLRVSASPRENPSVPHPQWRELGSGKSLMKIIATDRK